MPTYNVPIQPEYADAQTEGGLQELEGLSPDMQAMLLAQTQQQYIPSAQDMQSMALQEQYARAQQEALINQQQGIEQYQKNIDELRGRETQVDLTPLAALADAWGMDKSNFAGSYKRPMSNDEKQAQIMSLQEKLQAQKDKQTDNRTLALASALKAYSASKEDPTKKRLMESQIGKNNAIAQAFTPGQKSADVSFGKEYQDWRAQGGYAGVESNMQALERVADALAKNPDLTGGATSYLPDAVRKQTDSEAVALQQEAEKAVQAGLRATLGAQFTEKEGQQFMARTFDKNLKGTVNAEKLRAEIAKIRKQARAKEAAANYFEKTGSLRGLDTTQSQMNVGEADERAMYEALKRKQAESP